MSSPSKLQRCLHNQLEAISPDKTIPLDVQADEGGGQQLVLRRLNLTPSLPQVLLHCKGHAMRIMLLDVSYSMLEPCTLNTLCVHLTHLQALHAKSCGFHESLNNVTWPRRLHVLELSRNKLKECPQGIFQLMYLSHLNLSGNLISFVPIELLKIPSLEKCQLLNNPISNVPKEICREGVEKMRCFFAVEPLPMPQEVMTDRGRLRERGNCRRQKHSSYSSSASECHSNLRRRLLSHQGSFESGYESHQRHPSSSSTSSIDIDVSSECSECDSYPGSTTEEWRTFHPADLPKGYKKVQGSNLCQVYLPEDCSDKIEILEVKDLSMHPRVKNNEFLSTPVVRITPHGLKFSSKPAMITLPHCNKMGHSSALTLVPICSNTGQFQTTDWIPIDPCSECVVYEDCILFSSSHFSLFAVISSLPYPSTSMTLQPNVGGSLVVPELPGFRLHIPEMSVSELQQEVRVSCTVHYCDKSFNASDVYAPASACIKLEPHGMRFNHPVEITIPIPDYDDIKDQFPGARLELWSSQVSPDGHECDLPRHWELTKGFEIHLEDQDVSSGSCKLARFKVDHFSWYEFLYSVCTSSLHRLGLGATSVYNQLSSRARYISVRFQAFISHPRDLTFGLLVAIYKFGDPLTGLSNYPLLVADSGAKRIHLRIGDLHVCIAGCFSASEEVGEKLEREGRLVDFTGEDFCERFEFALKLKSTVSLPLPEGQFLGKLQFTQQEDSKSFNLIMVSLNTPYTFIVLFFNTSF